jgi:hypothetical protein
LADNGKSIYKILDYTSGLEVVQNMEAKDTKYRGIYRLFTAIGGWADKYSTNKLLPNVEIIAREISMERDRAETFLMELCFRTLVPVIKKVTTVEYDPSTSERDENLFNILNRNTVYLRPFIGVSDFKTTRISKRLPFLDLNSSSSSANSSWSKGRGINSDAEVLDIDLVSIFISSTKSECIIRLISSSSSCVI